ncbi:MAG: DNA primase, partial [Gammaproteobacteria bacterium]
MAVTTKSRFNEGLIKSLTGGDRITARPLYGHLFEFDPTHKILISGNHKPNISGTDDGIWRRIRLIPCEAQFLGDRADPSLEAKLLNELEHVAAWVLEGWDLYQISGSLSHLPKRIIDATAEYR